MLRAVSVSADLKQKKVNLATTSEDCGLGIRTIHKGRIGSSSTNNTGTVAGMPGCCNCKWQTCNSAGLGRIAWHGIISQTPLSFDESIKVEPEGVLDLIEKMLEGAEEHPAEVTSGSASLSSSTVTLANSRGVRYTDRHTGVSVSLEAIHGTFNRLRV